jgi:hypothetical protein
MSLPAPQLKRTVLAGVILAPDTQTQTERLAALWSGLFATYDANPDGDQVRPRTAHETVYWACVRTHEAGTLTHEHVEAYLKSRGEWSGEIISNWSEFAQAVGAVSWEGCFNDLRAQWREAEITRTENQRREGQITADECRERLEGIAARVTDKAWPEPQALPVGLLPVPSLDTDLIPNHCVAGSRISPNVCRCLLSTQQ